MNTKKTIQAFKRVRRKEKTADKSLTAEEFADKLMSIADRVMSGEKSSAKNGTFDNSPEHDEMIDLIFNVVERVKNLPPVSPKDENDGGMIIHLHTGERVKFLNGKRIELGSDSGVNAPVIVSNTENDTLPVPDVLAPPTLAIETASLAEIVKSKKFRSNQDY